MEKIKTRKVDRNLYVNYMKRAEECLIVARQSFSLGQWNASSINAIHSSIAAIDALCVYFLGQRHAGQGHEDAINLLQGIRDIPKEDVDLIANRVLRILKMKNMAEYEERLVHQMEAGKILKNAERLLEIVKIKLPK